MSGSDFDIIILGQGLAGTALAWSLRWHGQRILVIDRDRPGTSSRIAAGLITPITGQRMVKSWRWDELWPTALSFYRRVESECGSQFLEQRHIVRLVTSETEQQHLTRRMADESANLIREPDPAINPDWFDSRDDAFEMCDGGRLNVAAYLDASRKRFMADSQFVDIDLDLSKDVAVTDGAVRLPRYAISAQRLIFCQGFEGATNPWFQGVRFNPAKGEILTLRIEGLPEQRIIQRGVWLMPLGDGLFRAGATYEWTDLDPVPTAAGREEICSRLREFLRVPFDVVAHDAAIRPILLHQPPAIGLHPRYKQLGFFNGLGSKGALQAPWLAKHLTECLLEHKPIDPEVSLDRYLAATVPPGVELPDPNSERLPPLTTLAQAIVQQAVRPGDIAIDATAGNGHDTVFLAASVGPAGCVFAFDIQAIALSNTAKKLQETGLQNVQLIECSHAEMGSAIPCEIAGQVCAVMLNLGYLPGGDKGTTTHEESTLAAIRSGLSLLKPGGIMTILAYPGHDAGASEAHAVVQLLETLSKDEFTVSEPYKAVSGRRVAPRLLVVSREIHPCE